MLQVKDFIEGMGKSNVEVIRFVAITETMLKRFFSKNRNKIEEILIILKQGEKAK